MRIEQSADRLIIRDAGATDQIRIAGISPEAKGLELRLFRGTDLSGDPEPYRSWFLYGHPPRSALETGAEIEVFLETGHAPDLTLTVVDTHGRSVQPSALGELRIAPASPR